MKRILSVFLVVLIAVGSTHATDVKPTSPIGMSVVKSGHLIKLFYRGERSGKVKVSIYNRQGEKVFTETLNNTEQFMRPYNFSFLPEGTYTVELEDASGDTWSRSVNYSVSNPQRVAHLTRFNDPGSKYMVAVPGSGTNALTIKIYDERQKLIFQETEVVEGDFARLYNLNKVPGKHTFEVWGESGRIDRISKPLQK